LQRKQHNLPSSQSQMVACWSWST